MTIYDIIKEKIRKNSFVEFLFISLVWVILAIIIHFIFCWLHADRMPKGYYLSSYATDAGIAYRIKVVVDYNEDITAFSTPDYKVALETLKELQK